MTYELYYNNDYFTMAGSPSPVPAVMPK